MSETEEVLTTYPKLLCVCGRMARVHPETGKARKHHPGKNHPTLTHLSKEKRKAGWCPEVRD